MFPLYFIHQRCYRPTVFQSARGEMCLLCLSPSLSAIVWTKLRTLCSPHQHKIYTRQITAVGSAVWWLAIRTANVPYRHMYNSIYHIGYRALVVSPHQRPSSGMCGKRVWLGEIAACAIIRRVCVSPARNYGGCANVIPISLDHLTHMHPHTRARAHCK